MNLLGSLQLSNVEIYNKSGLLEEQKPRYASADKGNDTTLISEFMAISYKIIQQTFIDLQNLTKDKSRSYTWRVLAEILLKTYETFSYIAELIVKVIKAVVRISKNMDFCFLKSKTIGMVINLTFIEVKYYGVKNEYNNCGKDFPPKQEALGSRTEISV